jgi:hypothetical protein
MRRSLFSFFLSLLLVVSVATSASAHVEGAIEGMTLKLIDASGNAVATTETGEDGAWSFAIPRSGEYTIVIDDGEIAEARSTISEKVPGAVFQTASVTRTSGPLVTIGWSMKDIPWIKTYESARAESTGLASGPRRYKAVQFIREFDKSVAILVCTQAGTASGTISYTVRK